MRKKVIEDKKLATGSRRLNTKILMRFSIDCHANEFRDRKEFVFQLNYGTQHQNGYWLLNNTVEMNLTTRRVDHLKPSRIMVRDYTSVDHRKPSRIMVRDYTIPVPIDFITRKDAQSQFTKINRAQGLKVREPLSAWAFSLCWTASYDPWVFNHKSIVLFPMDSTGNIRIEVRISSENMQWTNNESQSLYGRY